jgi:hypothetical protein
MITKKDYCEHIIRKFAESENVAPKTVKENPDQYVTMSTSCGIALDFLGLINDQSLKDYISNRDGTAILNGNHLLSTREVLDLLPDKLIVNLIMKEVYSYYDIPIVFSALNTKTADIFICLFVDESESSIRYICTEISEQTLQDLHSNKIDLRSVFEPPGKKYNIYLNDKSSKIFEAIESSEDITPFLPEKGLFIGNIK